MRGLQDNTIDILYLTPEMLSEISMDSRSFCPKQDPTKTVTYTPKLLAAAEALKRDPPELSSASFAFVPLLVIDEIHYISEVGHDFRLDYRTVWAGMKDHPWFRAARKLGLSATINARVRMSIQDVLPIDQWNPVLGCLYRDNIAVRILSSPINNQARLNYVHGLHMKDQVCSHQT